MSNSAQPTSTLKLTHPGEILLEEFLKPMEISQYRLAKDIGVLPQRINEIAQGKRDITAAYGLDQLHYICLLEKREHQFTAITLRQPGGTNGGLQSI